MKKISNKLIVLLLFILPTIGIKAQGKYSFSIEKYSPEVSLVTMDSTFYVQSTVVEYPDYLVLIELPFVDYGAEITRNLHEDTAKAIGFIAFLDKNFNHKPIKYVLHSHWHLHSLSGITPFFKTGATLITTRQNWEYSTHNGLLGLQAAAKFSNQILEVSKDTFLFSKTKFPIEVLYLDSTYQNKPTKDYLFFYFPKLKTLHASCMCAINEVDFKAKKDYLYSDRLTDLHRSITSRNLTVDNFIKLERFKSLESKSVGHVFTYDYFTKHIQNGKSLHQRVSDFTNLSSIDLLTQRDSILLDAINKKLNPEIINSAVYDCIKNKQFEKAVALAQILNLFSPGELNYIDTMGEAYYDAGDMEMAKYYDSILKKKDAKFTGGIESWEQNRKSGSY